MKKKRQRGKRIGTNINLFRSLTPILATILTTFTAFPLPAQLQAPVVGPGGVPTSRSIEGIVLGDGGAPVPGAVVLIKDSKTLQVRSYIAQQDGRYHFYGLSTDINYQLRAESKGLTSKTKTVSVFNSHGKVTLNLKLTKKLK
jgi:hypothetical protein